MRFLGEDPDEWDEELAFQYELRFATQPDDATVARLARAWHEHCLRSPVDRGGCLFSKEFAYLTAFPKGTHRDTFAHVAAFVRAVNDSIAPLREVVHLTAAEDYDDLDPGPDLPHSQRPADPSYPAPAKREAFDAVLRDIADAERRANYAELVAAPKGGKLGLAFCEPAAEMGDADVAAEMRALYPPDDGMKFAGAPDRPRRVPLENASHHTSLYLCIGGEPATLPLPSDARGLRLSNPHPSGKWVADRAWRGREHFVVIVDASTGELREVWHADAGDELSALAWLTGDQLAVLTSKNVVVLEVPDAGPAKMLASTKAGGYVMFACQGGRLLWLGSQRFLGWNGSKLTAVGAFKIDYLYFVNEIAGRIVLRHSHSPTMPAEQYFEVTGLADVLAKAAVAKAPRKRR
jgi:hypothetical protein